MDGIGAAQAAALEDLHDDPADRFIAPLSLRPGATLVTCDDKLMGWAARTKGAHAMDAKKSAARRIAISRVFRDFLEWSATVVAPRERQIGAPGRTRTSTPSPATDFESAASTDFATGAARRRTIMGAGAGCNLVGAGVRGYLAFTNAVLGCTLVVD